MFRRYLAQVTVAAVAADFLLALGTVEVVYLLRFRPGLEIAWDETLPSPAIALLAYAAAWVAILWISGHYRLRMVRSPTADAFVVGRATLVLAALMLSLLYLLRGSDVSRLFLLGLFPAQFLATLVFKEPIRGSLRYLSSRRLDAHRVLIVGANDRARHFASQLSRHPEYGVRIVGFLQEDGAVTLPPDVVGSVSEILTVLERVVVDEVAICLPRSAWEKTEAIIALCEEAGKSVRIPLDLPGEARSTGYLESVGGLPVYSIVSGPDRMLSLAVKRTFDIVASILALVVLAPLLVFLGLLLLVVQRRPILFRQMRVGLHGRLFEILKFRTMIAGAEAHRSELAERNQVQGPAFKLDDDPRVTRVGRLLRRSSIDELPQLWNVLVGDMSLVGPRPPLPNEVAQYNVWHRRRLSMKPGITGLWQVRKRRAPEFDQWVRADLEYIDRWSLWLDLQIMARTIPAVLTLSGR